MSRSRVPLFLNNLFEAVDDQQQSPKCQVAMRPSFVEDQRTQHAEHRLKSLEFPAYELRIRVVPPSLLQAFDRPEQSVDKPGTELGGRLDAQVRFWIPLERSFARAFHDVVKEPSRPSPIGQFA